MRVLLLQIAFAFLSASIIGKVDCLPKGKVDGQRMQEMETIRADILTRLGLTEPLDSSEPLTQDQEATVAAFMDYQTAEEERRAHVKEDISEKSTPKYTFVGRLQKKDTNTAATTVPISASNGQLDGYSILFELDKLENTTSHTLTKAELLLFQSSPVPYQHVPYSHIKVKAATNEPTLIVNTNYDGLEQPGYKTFDITPIIAIWLKRGSSGPLVLEVSAHCTDTPDCGKHIFDDELGEKLPKLVISREVEENTLQQRLKRQVDKVSKNKPDDEYSGFNETLDEESESNETSQVEHETTCSLHSIAVNFHKDLGFDFILAPKSFNLNYCLGTCNDHSSPFLYEVYRHLGPNSPVSSIQPHCVMHTTQNLMLVAKIKGLLSVLQLVDVIVTSCRCA